MDLQIMMQRRCIDVFRTSMVLSICILINFVLEETFKLEFEVFILPKS